MVGAEFSAQLNTNRKIISCYGSSNLAPNPIETDGSELSALACFGNFCLEGQFVANIKANHPDMGLMGALFRLMDWQKNLETSALQALCK